MFSVGSADLAGGLSQVLLGLVVLGFIASVVGIRAKKSGSKSVALDVSASLAFGWVAICIFGLLFAAWQTFFTDTTLITAAGVAEPPLAPVDENADGPLPALTGAYSSDRNLEIRGLPIGILVVLFIGKALTVVLLALPGVAVRVVTVNAAAGRPFAARVGTTLGVLAIVVLVVGLARDLVEPIGQTLAANAVLPDEGPLSAPGVFTLTVQFWPFAAALALAALAAVFRHGFRLQKDTEGLV